MEDTGTEGNANGGDVLKRDNGTTVKACVEIFPFFFIRTTIEATANGEVALIKVRAMSVGARDAVKIAARQEVSDGGCVAQANSLPPVKAEAATDEHAT